MNYDVADTALAAQGLLRIEWAEQHMPVLRILRERFAADQPLRGQRVGACLHITTETANLARVLIAGGAELALCASNPLSTQDDVAAALATELGVATFAVHGEDRNVYYRHIHSVLDTKPTITIDDGADLVSTLHSERQELLTNVLGGTEETTTGVIRLRSMAKDGALKYPLVAVNDADTKHFFDNRYGTGQSTIDGILRATNILLAGKRFVVSGYGWCGRGLSERARGMGAHVIVTEVNPLRALQAVLDGFQVMPMAEACRVGEVFVTVTGDRSVLRKEHFEQMKDGAILANSGHFDVEINLVDLAGLSTEQREIRQNVREYRLADGRRLYLLGEGRLVNLASGEGHPASVMDMSFANQSLVAAYIAREGQHLEKRVHSVPREIDEEVARLKLAAMGIQIDRLTPEQEEYLNSWKVGT